jgi:hypothetical protein
MSELEIKYNLLDTVLQKQVLEFIDFLVSATNTAKTDNLTSYKNKILKTSVWTDSETNYPKAGCMKDVFQMTSDFNESFEDFNKFMK